MKRDLQGQYITISTVGEMVQAFVPSPLPPATINTCLKQLEGIGIVRELTGRKRNRLYAYSRYMDVMNQGTEPPS